MTKERRKNQEQTRTRKRGKKGKKEKEERGRRREKREQKEKDSGQLSNKMFCCYGIREAERKLRGRICLPQESPSKQLTISCDMIAER